MELVYIVFIWIVAMIAYNVWKGKQKKKKAKKAFFKNPMTMSIGERIKRKKKLKG